MKKLEFIPMLILLSITLSGCNLFDSKNNLPIEMVSFNSLTDKKTEGDAKNKIKIFHSRALICNKVSVLFNGIKD